MKRLVRWATPAAILGLTLALAVPAIASAAVGMEQGGKALPVGSALNLASVGNVFFPSVKYGTISCGSASIAGELTQNREEPPVIVKKGTEEIVVKPGFPFFQLVGVAGGAKFNNCGFVGGATPIEGFQLNSLENTGTGVGKAAFSFNIWLRGVKCNYSSTSAKVSYARGSSSLSIGASELHPVPSACGNLEIAGEFSVSSGGSPVVLN